MAARSSHLCLAGDGKTPVRLTGPPRALRGRLPVANVGPRRGVLRDAVISGPEELLGEESRVRFRVGTTVVGPEQRVAVPISIALDPSTPPGEYRLEVEIEGDVRPVVVQVVEDVRLSVTPGRLVVENRPGETQTKQIVVSNGGNVDLTVGEIGDAVLDDELFECRTLRRALRELTDADADAAPEAVSVDRVLTEVARASRHVLERANRLTVRNAAGTTVVRPGQSSTIDLEIAVPETLSQHTRYRGTLPIYTRDLELVVVPYRPADAIERGSPPDAGAPRKKTTGKKTTGKGARGAKRAGERPSGPSTTAG